MRCMSTTTKRLRNRATTIQYTKSPIASRKKIQRNKKIMRMLVKDQRKPNPILKSEFIYQTYTVRLAKKPIIMPPTALMLRYSNSR